MEKMTLNQNLAYGVVPFSLDTYLIIICTNVKCFIFYGTFSSHLLGYCILRRVGTQNYSRIIGGDAVDEKVNFHV